MSELRTQAARGTVDEKALNAQFDEITAFTGMPAHALRRAFAQYAGVAAFSGCDPLVELHSEHNTAGEQFERSGFLLVQDEKTKLYSVGLPLDWWFVAKRGVPTIEISYQDSARGMVLSPMSKTDPWGLQLFCRFARITKQLGDGSLVVMVWDNQTQKSFWASPAFRSTAEKGVTSYSAKAEGFLNRRFPLWKLPWEYWEERDVGQPNYCGA